MAQDVADETNMLEQLRRRLEEFWNMRTSQGYYRKQLWNKQQRPRHSLDLALPAMRLYRIAMRFSVALRQVKFTAGSACFPIGRLL